MLPGEQPATPESDAAKRPHLEDEWKLVQAVLRKDRKATAEFVRSYADAVYAYVRLRLAPRSDLVEDMVQDVFLAAWQALAGFRGQSALRSWLLAIARHKVEDYYRSRLRQPQPLPGSDEEPVDTVSPLLDDLLDRDAIDRKARAVLAALPEQYALVLLWRYWEKASARDIALKTGRTEKAVERLLARARNQFRKRWENA